MLRTESAASSKIENLTANARIAEAETLGNTKRRNAAMIVANTMAMQAAIALTNQISGDAILAMHAALMNARAPKTTYRRQVAHRTIVIGGGNLAHEAPISSHHTTTGFHGPSTT